MSALTFANPLMLAALAALPVIWLLLRATPPSPSRVKFPAFILLRRLARTEETPDKTPWWLLALRLLIAGLVIAGLAGPALNAPPPTTATGPVIIVVDNSWAAAANWDKRQTAISNIANDIARTDANAYLIATAGGDEQLAPMSGEDLKRAAEKLAPQPILPDLAAA
ncbi:MAG: BatA domain-containing protein, partial [Parvularculaceae bacterium]|nr:BatA domain-containing protein [Parvularculaceae bacterium]